MNGMEGLGSQPLTVRIANPRNEQQAQRMAEVATMQGKDPSEVATFVPPTAAPSGDFIPGVDNSVDDLLNAAFAGVNPDAAKANINAATFSVGTGYGGGAAAVSGGKGRAGQEERSDDCLSRSSLVLTSLVTRLTTLPMLASLSPFHSLPRSTQSHRSTQRMWRRPWRLRLEGGRRAGSLG